MGIEYLKNNGVDVQAGLDLLGDIDTYNETLNDFLAEQENRLPALEKYKEENDMENYAVQVHAMKSDSKYLGFTKLAELALEHQLQSQNNNYDYVTTNYDELIQEANRIAEIVKEYLKK